MEDRHKTLKYPSLKSRNYKVQNVLDANFSAPLDTGSAQKYDMFPSESIIKLNDRFLINFNNYFLDSSYNQIEGHSHHLLEISYVKKRNRKISYR
ncbi:hypothetical protein JYU11_03435 [bacterium AH-315-G05]|nr:hypothetical protein [bacterium AH-315-G05]